MSLEYFVAPQGPEARGGCEGAVRGERRVAYCASVRSDRLLRDRPAADVGQDFILVRFAFQESTMLLAFAASSSSCLRRSAQASPGLSEPNWHLEPDDPVRRHSLTLRLGLSRRRRRGTEKMSTSSDFVGSGLNNGTRLPVLIVAGDANPLSRCDSLGLFEENHMMVREWLAS